MIKEKLILVLLFFISMVVIQCMQPTNFFCQPPPGECWILGMVVDKITAQPLPEVEIIATKLENEKFTNKIEMAITNSEGFYIIDRIIPGEYLISAYPIEHEIRKKYLFRLSEQRIHIPADKPIIELNFSLQKSGTVSGTIFQSDAITPLSNVDIYAFTDKGYFQMTKTNSNGKYKLEGLEPQDSFELKITINGYYLERENLSIRLGEDIDHINFTLPYDSPTSIEGAVILEGTNNPVPNTGIIFANENIFATSITDNAGRYSIIGVPAGTYEVFAYAEGYSELHRIDIIIVDGIKNIIELVLPLHTQKGQKKGRYASCEGQGWPWEWFCKKLADQQCKGAFACFGCCWADYMKCSNDIDKCLNPAAAYAKCVYDYGKCEAGCGGSK